ncbi:hypothetical protein Tco_0010910 [Tanacetum coccineum]
MLRHDLHFFMMLCKEPHKGSKLSAHSDVMDSFSVHKMAIQLPMRLDKCLGDDLKKAQDHSQRQAWRGDEDGGSVGGCDEMVDSPEFGRRIWRRWKEME